MTEPSRLTPDRRRELTRDYLLDAAAVVFARRGFHGASLDEVAAAAGFTKGAVYSNFDSKDDLFLALLDHRLERRFAAVETALEDDPDTRSDQRTAMGGLTTQFLWNDPDWSLLSLEFILYAARKPEVRDKLAQHYRSSVAGVRRMIDEDCERRGILPTIPPDVLAPIVLALFNGLWIDHIQDPSTITQETVDAAIALVDAATTQLDLGIDEPTDG